jgi:ATP-dependent Zn protease
MSFINSLELTHTTLLVLFILPFLYFGYHSKYWYDPRKLSAFDFFLRVVCVIVSTIILIRFYQSTRGIKPIPTDMLILHLAPLVLTLLIVAQGKKAGLRYASGSNSVGGDPTTAPNTYRPAPLNNEIKRLSWDDLIIDDALRFELISVMELLRDPKTAKKYGIEVPRGILLNGPPGTGKTTIAKVLANTAGLSFFVLQMNEIVSKWVGESEKNLTALFNVAIANAPSIIFIDEVDSIGKTRSGNQVYADNLLNHLLQLVDGVLSKEGLYIIAATNRADLVDSALKRAGRLNKVIEVPLPSFEARIKLFHLYLSKLQLADDIDISVLSELTENKSAADIKEICNQAGLNAFKREAGSKRKDYMVRLDDIELAMAEFMGQR